MILRSCRLASSIIFILFVSACTWVELSEAGKHVNIVNTVDVNSCKKVGNVSAKTRFHIVGDTEREKKKVQKELDTLARNEAVTIRANTLVAEAPPSEGKQRFIAYRCP